MLLIWKFTKSSSIKLLSCIQEIVSLFIHCCDVYCLLSVEKREIYSHWKIFRQITYLVLSFVKTLLWRKFFQKSVRVNFRNFHTVVWLHHTVEITEFYSHSEKFRQMNFLAISLVRCYFHEIFAKNVWELISAISSLCLRKKREIYCHLWKHFVK